MEMPESTFKTIEELWVEDNPGKILPEHLKCNDVIGVEFVAWGNKYKYSIVEIEGGVGRVKVFIDHPPTLIAGYQPFFVFHIKEEEISVEEIKKLINEISDL